MKYLRTFTIVCVLGLVYTSCVKKANYPDYPVITYNSIMPFCTGSATDSILLRVNFTDGNGAIGYPQQQQGVAPDFFVEPLLYNAVKNTYDTVVLGGDTALKFSYLVPDITPSGNDKELNGIIQINLESVLIQDLVKLSGLLPNIVYYQLEFKVWMYDRNGNKSDVLITPAVQICH